MPSFSIQYEHMDQLAQATLSANSLDDAYARLESLKATGELDDGSPEREPPREQFGGFVLRKETNAYRLWGERS